MGGFVETRNGSINLFAESRVDGGIEARNGSISLAQASRVDGSVETRNGAVTMDQATVTGTVKSRSGDIELVNGSQVEGDIRIDLEDSESSGGWFGIGGDYPDAGNVSILSGSQVSGDVILVLPEDYDGEIPTVTIDAESRVEGSLKVDSRVQLEVEGEVSGGITQSSE